MWERQGHCVGTAPGNVARGRMSGAGAENSNITGCILLTFQPFLSLFKHPVLFHPEQPSDVNLALPIIQLKTPSLGKLREFADACSWVGRNRGLHQASWPRRPALSLQSLHLSVLFAPCHVLAADSGRSQSQQGCHDAL